MNLTLQQLQLILPPHPAGLPELWIAPLSKTLAEFEIYTPHRIAAFLSQCLYESSGFTRLDENLNYSAPQLLTTFPKYFTATEVLAFAFHPKWIANRVYALRLGNGTEASGDGWNYRGRGLFQLTGRDNYIAYGISLGLPLEQNPNLLLTPLPAARSAGAFWHGHNMNALADAGDIRTITSKVSGSNRTSADRGNLYLKVLKTLEF